MLSPAFPTNISEQFMGVVMVKTRYIEGLEFTDICKAFDSFLLSSISTPCATFSSSGEKNNKSVCVLRGLDQEWKKKLF